MNNMEKEFIPYEQALALKELGFDDYCLTSYLNGNLQTGISEIFWFQHSYRSHKKQEFVSAPTFSQAFRWFREKHHLIGGIEYIGGATPTTTWWDIYVVGHFNTDTSKMTMKYQPYEEAELACLRKLIEIVKNGK